MAGALVESVAFARRNGRRSGDESRHLRIRPPKGVSRAAQNRQIPDAADFSEEFPAGLHADGILCKYRCENRVDSRGPVEKIVRILASKGIDAPPAIFRRCIKCINKCLSGLGYDIPFKLRNQFPRSSDPPEGCEFSIGTIDA